MGNFRKSTIPKTERCRRRKAAFLLRLARWFRQKPFVCLLWLLGGVFVVWCLAGIAFILWSGAKDVGDAYGSLNTLFSGFAFVGVIIAIILQSQELKEQRKELALNREELTLTREELKGQKIELAIQNDTAQLQRFESTFFSMLQELHNIRDGLQAEFVSRQGVVEVCRGRAVFAALLNPDNQNVLKTFSQVIEQMPSYNDEPYDVDDYLAEVSVEREKQVVSVMKRYDLDVYIRYVTLIITYVDRFFPESTFAKRNQKFSYIVILNESLSQGELVLIFYAALQTSRKKLLEKYAFFSPLFLGGLISPQDAFLYDLSTFSTEAINDLSSEIRGEPRWQKFFERFLNEVIFGYPIKNLAGDTS